MLPCFPVHTGLSTPCCRFGLLVFLCAPLLPTPAAGDLIVIANRTRQEITCRIVPAGSEGSRIQVAAGALAVAPVSGPCQLLYEISDDLVRYQLDANTVYYFSQDEQGWIKLNQLDLGEEDEPVARHPAAEHPVAKAVGEIPVKILVDNHELTTRQVWEARLRKRVAAVSDILERYCRLRLKIVAVEQWDAGEAAIDFRQSLQVFQQRVDPQPARLAIGFTGRYQRQESGRMHLGSTTGLLQTHILVREWSDKMSEPERTEVLLHEVGHYLGAVHSPDPLSVMRPVLADDKAIYRQFRIGFDPVNTLIINMISEEIRSREVSSLGQLSPATRQRLSQIYGRLAKDVPNDNSATQFQFQLSLAGDTPLADATRRIVREVSQAAEQRHSPGQPPALDGDQLTEHYVGRAAEVAAALPGSVAASALLLGLGIALDDSDTLVRGAMTREFCAQIETSSQRGQRRRHLGSPTVRGRRDLAQHFFLSAYLTAIVGAQAAESAGLVKELADARSGSGFSYADLAADLAGIAFAQRVLQGQLALSDMARDFRVDAHMPPIHDLPEGLGWTDIAPQFVGDGPGSFRGYRQEIRLRIQRLAAPAPRPAGAGSERPLPPPPSGQSRTPMPE